MSVQRDCTQYAHVQAVHALLDASFYAAKANFCLRALPACRAGLVLVLLAVGVNLIISTSQLGA